MEDTRTAKLYFLSRTEDGNGGGKKSTKMMNNPRSQGQEMLGENRLKVSAPRMTERSDD